MPSSPLERLDEDVLGHIFHRICFLPTQTLKLPIYIDATRLLPLSTVSKEMRSLTLPWIFHHIFWRPDETTKFIPTHLLIYVKVLSLVAVSEPKFHRYNENELKAAFSSLKSTTTLKISGLWGSSNFFYPIIASMPVLHNLEWMDSPLLVRLGAEELTKLTHLHKIVYRTSVDRPYHKTHGLVLDTQRDIVSSMIRASQTILTHIEMEGLFVHFDIMATLDLSNLHTLILIGRGPENKDTHLTSILDRTPNLRVLEVKFVQDEPRFSIFPEVLDGSESSEHQGHHIPPDLESLTLYNPCTSDGILDILPSNLRSLTFLQYPYPYRLQRPSVEGERESRLVLGTVASDEFPGNWPELTATRILHLLQKSDATQLQELRISFTGPVSTAWIVDIGIAFPVLEVLELHRWSQDPAEHVPSLEFYIPALTTLPRLRELLLDMHLSDELEAEANSTDQEARAEWVAKKIPFLLTIGFLQALYRSWSRPSQVTLHWVKFDITRLESSTEVTKREGFDGLAWT